MNATRCRRCGMEVEPNTIHIFSGGEPRRQELEKLMRARVTLCGVPITPLEEEEAEGVLKGPPSATR